MPSARVKTRNARSQPSDLQVCFQFREKGTCPYGSNCKFKHVSEQNKPLPTSTQKTPAKKRQRDQDDKPSKRPKRTDSRSHINAFFAEYRDFNYDSSQPVMAEFYRMCDWFDWDKEDPRRQEARDHIKDALTKQFNDIYGVDVDDLAAWQNLCTVLNLSDIPNELKACRGLVKSLYVNIVDLVDTPTTQKPVEHFKSEAALSEYTQRTGKYFPADNIHAGSLLKYLLRHIISPGSGEYHPRKIKRRSKK